MKNNPHIDIIARLISEDSSMFDDFQDKWESKTVLNDDTYFKVIGILKQTCEDNGCKLDYSRLAVDFIPPGFVIKNIFIDCPNRAKKKELVDALVRTTGDRTLLHTFDDNLRVNLYHALSRQFAEKVRYELDLDITHQFRALPPGSDRSDRAEVMPMCTVTVPKVSLEDEEESIPEPEMEMPLEQGQGGDELTDLYAPEDEEALPEPRDDLVSLEDIKKISNFIQD